MYEYQIVAGIGIMVVMFALAFFIFSIVISFLPRRSDLYRKDLVNMYVASTIRTLAKKDNLDLDSEYETFKKWAKKRHLQDKSLDYTIEEELKDKVSDEMSKKEKK